MSKTLTRLLRREQWAFLARDRSAWGDHLGRVRHSLGEGLQSADPTRPVLILGAGPGLEIPWASAPPLSTGWDADPWSRAWTALRHRRWVPWVFEDMTGGLADLEANARRAIAEPWSGRRRDLGSAGLRLAGLLTSLQPKPAALQHWIATHQPGTIVCANVMGQFGVVSERVVEGVFGGPPWTADPERADPLAEALEEWTRRAILAFLAALCESKAALWMVHDRAVVFGGGRLGMGAWADPWVHQLTAEASPLEVSDALAGLDVLNVLSGLGRKVSRGDRWIWELAPGQRHLVEALSCPRPPDDLEPSIIPYPHEGGG